jgi:hypothetical protein
LNIICEWLLETSSLIKLSHRNPHIDMRLPLTCLINDD